MEHLLRGEPDEVEPVLPLVVPLLEDETLYEKRVYEPDRGKLEGGVFERGGDKIVKEPIGDLAALVLVHAGARGVEGLQSKLVSANASVRRRVTCALEQSGPRGTGERLLPLVDDPDEHTRGCAVGALGYSSGDWAIASLCRAATSDSSELVRNFAISALGHVQGVSAAAELRSSCLLRALHDKEPRVVAFAVHALSDLGIQAATPDIVSILRTGEMWERNIAAQALGTLGDRRAIPALLKATHDSDPDVRASAIAAIRKIRSTKQPSSSETKQQ